MHIENLQWDDHNIEHIAGHNVNPEEVEDVCYGLHISRKQTNQRHILSGQSSNGRYLNVVIEYISKGQYRPVTAFEMSDNYKRSFKKRMKL